MKTNPKSFWNMVRQKTKVKDGISDLVGQNGQKITDDSKKAECLNDFFVSVFTKEDLTNIPDMPDRPFNTVLSNIEIN